MLLRSSGLPVFGFMACLAACSHRDASGGGSSVPGETGTAQKAVITPVSAGNGSATLRAEEVSRPEESLKRAAPASGDDPRALPSPRQLRSLLPADLPGMRRTNTKTEQSGGAASGVSVAEAVAVAEAEYESAHDAEGGMKALTLRMTACAAAGELPVHPIGSAPDGGVEVEASDPWHWKGTTYSGYKAVEGWRERAKQAEIEVIVADRFVVKLEGRNVTIEEVKAVLSRIDLVKLASMKSSETPGVNSEPRP